MEEEWSSCDHDVKHNKSPEKHKVMSPTIDEQLNQYYQLLPLELCLFKPLGFLLLVNRIVAG